ncbi:MAG: PspC domain-containing protein [Acidimicrobiia bacterium]|nr:PspC domain-containing protein [Acidimicrobiia bacterium]
MNTTASSFRLSDYGIVRSYDDRVVAGLAAGIGRRLGVETVFIRAAFAVLSFVWGLGIVLYLAGWAATLDSVSDNDVESRDPITDTQRLGLAMAFLSVLLAFRAIGIWPGDAIVFPAMFVIFGLAFLFDRRAIDSRSALLSLVETPEKPARSRTVVGVLLVIVGLGIFGGNAAPQFGSIFIAVAATGAGLTVLFGPWIWSLAQDLGVERTERIRQEERAEVAAHLHDSVLQTLALIQRSEDPKKMVTLARAQERELRRWLFDSSPVPGSDRLSTAIQAVADRIEAEFDIPVEVIGVGDTPFDEVTTPLVAAAGEALMNAAKHSGAGKITVYHEVTEDAIEVFVTDQGKGFDLDTVDGDRHGVSDSIVARMRRHGGSATIVSEPGEGTEVALSIRRNGT